MRYITAGTLAACLTTAAAFRDTSPYLLLSTSTFPSISQGGARQIQAGSDVLETTRRFLRSCPSDTYIIVSQPNVHADDFSNPRAVPLLRKALLDEKLKTKLGISEVLGEIDPEEINDYLSSNCQAASLTLDGSSTFDISDGNSLKPLVVRADFEALPTAIAERTAQLAANDHLVHSLLSFRPSTNYTIIYTTTPLSAESVGDMSYTPLFIEPLHMELKRFADGPPNSTGNDTRPLFEKYQFFTPGLFMGLLVTLILLAILSVGLTALSSLQVSYGAFDKEMGPAAQKKQ